MRILIVNDDGYKSAGIRLLAKKLAFSHEVTVVAPIKCNSGMAHAMTFGKPIYLKQIKLKKGENYTCYSLSGTPADCVKLGNDLVKSVDLVISGINNEPNIGTTVVYSGTANAAMEATLLKHKSMAVSSNPENDADFDYIVDFFLKNFQFYYSMCSYDYALNININNKRIGNIDHKITPLGVREYSDIYLIDENSKRGLPHRLVGEPLPVKNPEDCDVTLYNKGYATITPLTSDNTCISSLKILKDRVEKQ